MRKTFLKLLLCCVGLNRRQKREGDPGLRDEDSRAPGWALSSQESAECMLWISHEVLEACGLCRKSSSLVEV